MAVTDVSGHDLAHLSHAASGAVVAENLVLYAHVYRGQFGRVWFGQPLRDPAALVNPVLELTTTSGIEFLHWPDGLIGYGVRSWSRASIASPDCASDWPDALGVTARMVNAHLLAVHVAAVQIERFNRPVDEAQSPLPSVNRDRSIPGQWSSLAALESLRPAEFMIGEHLDAIPGAVVPLETLREAVSIIEQLTGLGERRALEIVSLLHRAAHSLRRSDHGLSVSSAWTAAEAALDLLWADYVNSHATPRRDRLADHRVFTAAVRLELLQTAQRLPDHLAVRLHDLRQSRNSWLHRLALPDADTAATGVNTAAALVEHVLGIRMGAGGYFAEGFSLDPSAHQAPEE